MKEIIVKQAKPSTQDNEVVLKFFQACEEIFEEGTDPRIDSESPPQISAEEAKGYLEELWREVSCSWGRVYWAGRCAIDNACDPTLDVLDFKPELRINSELLEIVREIASVHKATKAERAVALAAISLRAETVIAELDRLRPTVPEEPG